MERPNVHWEYTGLSRSMARVAIDEDIGSGESTGPEIRRDAQIFRSSQRVNRQSETATALAFWLSGLTRAFPGSDLDGPAGVVKQVWHSSLQAGKENLVGKGKQMEKGPATFAFVMESPFQAAWLPHCLEIFTVRILPRSTTVCSLTCSYAHSAGDVTRRSRILDRTTTSIGSLR